MDSNEIVNPELIGNLSIKRGIITVEGPNAVEFLQGQLSQNVADLNVGESTWSFLLTPQGKTVALLRVQKRDEASFLAFCEPKCADLVKNRLQSFVFRVDVSIEADVRVVTVRQVDRDRPERDLLSDWPDFISDSDIDGNGEVNVVDEEVFETMRIHLGIPSNEIELSEERIPHETGFTGLSVDFSKGCYVGQELVARIESRGRVRKSFMRLILPLGLNVAVDDDVQIDGSSVGAISSLAPYVLKEGRPAIALISGDFSEDQVAYVNGEVTSVERAVPLG